MLVLAIRLHEQRGEKRVFRTRVLDRHRLNGLLQRAETGAVARIEKKGDRDCKSEDQEKTQSQRQGSEN